MIKQRQPFEIVFLSYYIITQQLNLIAN